MKFPVATSLALAALLFATDAAAQTLVEYDPVGMQASGIPLFPLNTAPSITASDLTQTGFVGGWGNTDVWPVGQLGLASPMPDLGQYVTFQIDAPMLVTYTSLTYSRRSYQSDGNRAASIRTSLDGFAADVDTLTGLNAQGNVTLDFNLSSLAPTAGPVDFRIYFYDAPTAGMDWVDLTSTNQGGTGVVLFGSVSNDVGINYCMANTNSTGVIGMMGANGSTDVAANDLTLEANGLPTNSFSFFITSMTQGFIMNPAGSEGNLCVGGSIGRYVGAGQIQQAGSAGRIELALDLTAMPQPLGFVSVAPGETWNFQAWYRDFVGGAATSNFTDGLQVDF